MGCFGVVLDYGIELYIWLLIDGRRLRRFLYRFFNCLRFIVVFIFWYVFFFISRYIIIIFKRLYIMVGKEK